MSTYVLVHGASSDGTHWQRVTPLLTALGHRVLTPDLPISDPRAGLTEYADAIVEAIGEHRDVVLVAQSMAGFSAPIAAARVPVDLLVLVAAMVPVPGETAGRWWAATGQPEAQRAVDLALGRDPDAPFDPDFRFLHDLPADLRARMSATEPPHQADTPFTEPWPLSAWPDVPTHALVGRDDRLFPPDFLRRVTRERLGIDAEEIPGGHLPALSQPEALVERLEAARTRS
ncbi:alpha/beta fold hydrolase [Actinokineospora bangkokensis]|uniref:Alpha/beta hydrolase n=1 Tax=Actinokineospora bangkokensis TaxID=1193682 RepID=A0A1Q9LQ41_9PSEU|nr:alpha/beta hydrolase [Actinokineospora bangkokensis]OLR94142.1 alpha/beta hydrolase [Actinokineospora bangkokensis]